MFRELVVTSVASFSRLMLHIKTKFRIICLKPLEKIPTSHTGSDYIAETVGGRLKYANLVLIVVSGDHHCLTKAPRIGDRE